MVMQKHYDITRQRIDRFLPGGYWGDQNLSHQFYTHREFNSPWVIMEKYSVPDLKRIPFSEAVRQRFLSSRRNVVIGPTWSTHWFKVYIRIPPSWDGLYVGLNWVFSGESLVYTREGEPIYSLATDGGRDLLHLTDSCKPNQTYFFYIECACNNLNGISGIEPPNPNNWYEIYQADLLVIDRNVYKLHHNFEILRQLSNDTPRDSNRADKAMFAANKIMNVWDKFDYSTIFECIKISEDFLKLKNGQAQMELTCIGNCHIDTAWLWPYAETRRKVCRSWIAQLAHMDMYPEYHFTASQAQQFEWLLDNYPSTFDRLREKVKDGRFHPVGGTWVEMDTNVPSGESLCKQFLYGQRFFNRHLGFKSEVFWLPDTFGYAAQLPQIVRKCGMKYFFTQKLSWNNINQFPHTTFHWEALDGSKILSHMAPSNTYVAQVHVFDLTRSVENHKDRPYSNQALLLFGYGDGGGGPNPDMLERYRRLKDVDGLPKLKMTGPDEFYHGLDKDSDKLVTWKGELYFELHRGTYTNHGDVKRGNRLSELILHNLEIASSYAYYAMNNNYRVPQTELNRMWKMTLCNQFHDVLPGTCIELAYKEVFDYYNEIDKLGNRLLDDALRNIFYSNRIFNPKTEIYTELGVFNTLSWSRNEIIKVPLHKFKRSHDLKFDQISHDGKVGYKAAVELKPFTPTVLSLMDHPRLNEKESEFSEKKTSYGEPVSVSVDSVSSVFFLENSFIKAKFSDRGQLVSLYDKRVNRELIPKGAVAHQLQLFEDIPLNWDAWDVEVYHLEKFKNFTDATVNILEMGPVVASLEIKYNLTLGSSATIVVSLSSLSPRLDFHAKVDWRENRRFLKVEFTFDIRNDHAHFETQWGNIKRPNHYNTSWDMAKFEVCGHRFCDLSEYGYGVAIVNDMKYGYACHDNKIRLSLLRSSKGPDGNSDMKSHEFQYGIYPHPSRFLASDAMQVAHEFATPSVYLPISHQPNFNRSPLFQLRGDSNVFLETIKRSEDFDENLIVRLYEAYGGHARVRLMSPLPVSSIKEVNILEEDITKEEMGVYSDDDLEWEIQGFVQLDFKPFEIKTLRLAMRLNNLKNPSLTEQLTSCFENLCL